MIIHANYTHSIVGMVVLSAALGVIFLPGLDRRVALVIVLVSVSHWVLDLIIHRPDLPVLRQSGPPSRFRLGTVELSASGGVELALVVVGAAMYWRAALEVSAKVGRNGRLASISAAMIAAFGLLVLFVDYTS